MKLEFYAVTKTNFYIGGALQSFEIGGVDMCTMLDSKGQPIIPASSFKGAFREIVKNNVDDEISELYKNYLEQGRKALESTINSRQNYSKEEKSKYISDYEEVINNSSSQYLFGISGLNNSPKLLFSDLTLISPENKNDWFSIDKKNSIMEMEKTGKLESNPRIYKVARSGLKFLGNITFYQGDKLGSDAEKIVEEYIKKCLKIFNEGIFRIWFY